MSNTIPSSNNNIALGNPQDVSPQSQGSIWTSCLSFSCLPGKWNPKNWDAEFAKKITHIAGVILAICIVGLAIYTLIPGAYYTVFATLGIVSLLALIMGLVKYCQQKKLDPEAAVDKASSLIHNVSSFVKESEPT